METVLTRLIATSDKGRALESHWGSQLPPEKQSAAYPVVQSGYGIEPLCVALF